MLVFINQNIVFISLFSILKIINVISWFKMKFISFTYMIKLVELHVDE